MALPIPTRSDENRFISPDFIEGAVVLVYHFTSEQLRPPVVLVVGYHPDLIHALSVSNVEKVIVCDLNCPVQPANGNVAFLHQHSLRVGSGFKADIVILNLFNSTTINRWAPVYVIRDLLRRGIVRTFPHRKPYVYPIKATMSLRLYDHPTAVVTSKNAWQEGPLFNTDLLMAVSPRIDVLYEQYDEPAQTWPSHITVPASTGNNVLAVLEWSVQLSPNVRMQYLAPRLAGDVLAAKRLCSVGMMAYFAWPASSTMFSNAPKLTGGIKLSPTTEQHGTETSLTIQKMDTAIERWFGHIVAKEVLF